MSTEWKCLKQDGKNKKKILDKKEIYEHPLKKEEITVIESKGTRTKLGSSNVSSASSTLSLHTAVDPLDGFSDPLSSFAKFVDPLSQMISETDSMTIITKRNSRILPKSSLNEENDSNNEKLIPWNHRKSEILNKFTTTEKLSIYSSFFRNSDSVKSQIVVDQMKQRLEQLDKFDENDIQFMPGLSQQEYVVKIQQLNFSLVEAWRSGLRVNSLKIAIQCAKLLADTTPLQFYPSKFVLITDILDTFGKLVYERLKEKSSDNDNTQEASESARETCYNWFHKIASIRELLPRLYIEMAIIKCNEFINPNNYKEILSRMTRQIRGIGDPLVAIYVRCYLIRIGSAVLKDRDYMKENFLDFLFTFHYIFSTKVRSDLSKQNMDLTYYLSLYSPALEWIVQNMIYQMPDEKLQEVKFLCDDKRHNALLVQTLLNSFRHDFIASRSFDFVDLIKAGSGEGISKGSLFRILGQILTNTSPPSDQRLMILNECWKSINTLTNVSEYINCVEAWTQYVTKYLDFNILNKFLGDILNHVIPKRGFEEHYTELQNIVDKILEDTQDFEGLLMMDNFLPLIDLFQKESVRTQVCKNILQKYMQLSSADSEIGSYLYDPVIVQIFLQIGKSLNDSINSLTVDDERRQISNLISHFIRKVNYGRNFEQLLGFYVEARSNFFNLDSVYVTLVHCVNKLSFDTWKIMKCQHTKKTMAFVKACSAYSFITIPTIVSTINRLDLYLLSGNVALTNLCLGQADACFEAALNLLPELPKFVQFDRIEKSTEPYLLSYVSKFLSTLILVPDSPEKGVLYLLRLLIEKVKQCQFDANGTTLAKIYLNIMDMLSTMGQESFPYHIENLVSNDGVYGSDPKFINEVNNLLSQIVDELLVILKQFGDLNLIKNQCCIALELFGRVATKSDLNDDKMFVLGLNLWNLVIKNRQVVERSLLIKSVNQLDSFIARTSDQNYRMKLEDFVKRIKAKL